MKRVRKDNLIRRNKVDAALLELEILREADHPFLLRLDYFFQTDHKLYFIVPFVRGGELFEHLTRQDYLPEQSAKMIVL